MCKHSLYCTFENNSVSLNHEGSSYYREDVGLGWTKFPHIFYSNGRCICKNYFSYYITLLIFVAHFTLTEFQSLFILTIEVSLFMHYSIRETQVQTPLNQSTLGYLNFILSLSLKYLIGLL